MEWIKLWAKYLFKGMPKWAKTLQCKKCKMTFISPEAHFNHVMCGHNDKWDNE